MIITFAIWCIIFLLCFSYGFFIFRLFKILNADQQEIKNLSEIIIVFYIGFIFCYIVASVFSFFIPIGWIAFILIIIPASLILIKKSLIKSLLDSFNLIVSFTNPLIFFTVLIALLLFSLWLTSGPINNSDTYIYHAQSIHWIESYPAIKGLENFFNRLAYNSGWFVQNALFSFSFFGERSFHVLNGLLVFSVSMFFILEFIQTSKRNQIELPQIWGMLIIPLGIISIGSQASAPSTDMPVAYLSWLAGYVAMREKQQDNLFPSIFIITGLIVFAFTIKISIAPLFLIPLLMVLFYRKSIKLNNLIKLFIWGSLILTPWMIRNVIISGYIIYPSTSTAVPVDWKMPESLVRDDEHRIRAWGFYERGSANEVMEKPFLDRIKFWFFNLTINQKMMVVVSLFSPIVLTIILLFSFLKNELKFSKDIFISILGFFAGFLFWIFVSPNLRFGYVYLLFLFGICLAAGINLALSLFKFSIKNLNIAGVFGLALILIFLLFRSFNLNELKSRYLLPLDYNRLPTSPCKIDRGKVTILCADLYGECGYYPFPCHAWGNESVRMYSEKISDGFYMDFIEE